MRHRLRPLLGSRHVTCLPSHAQRFSPHLAAAQRATWQRLRSGLSRVLLQRHSTEDVAGAAAVRRVLSAFDALPYAQYARVTAAWLPSDDALSKVGGVQAAVV